MSCSPSTTGRVSARRTVHLLRQQRDLYRYINDETLRLANQGETMVEIAEVQAAARSRQHVGQPWLLRLSQPRREGYLRPLPRLVQWQPATLDELTPVEASKRYVEFMGGANAVLSKAKQAYDKGEYRWVAQVVNHVVFADPSNKAAKNLQADALEQLGYQAESGPWRNFYLTGAKELREGVKKLPTPNTASGDTVKAMTPEMFFDYLSVRVNRAKAANAKIALNVDFGKEGGKYLLELENGVLNHTAGVESTNADASVAMSRDTLNGIILQQTKLADAIKNGSAKVTGNQAKLDELVSYLDHFEFWFNIVTP
jgi:alkyl sulfatase BDS1-like metallo-beta-lactamase superfamily hydrolase